MSRRVARSAIVWVIVRKDLTEWSRDRFWVFMSGLVVVLFATVFWLLPSTEEETLYVGVVPAAFGEAFAAAAEVEGAWRDARARGQGVRVVGFDSEADLVATIDAGRPVQVNGRKRTIGIGVVVPPELMAGMLVGIPATVRVYVDAQVPQEIAGAMGAVVRELVYGARAVLGGRSPEAAFPARLPDPQTMVLGVDRAGDQVPFREKMRPLYAFIVLLMESLALAALIAVEIQSRTITALLVTPARVSDVLGAKVLTGTILALAQVLVVLAVTGAFVGAALGPLLAAVLLGGLMTSAIGMLTGAAGRDFMGTLFYGMLFLVPFFIPALAVFLPGTGSWVVRALPSWGVIRAMVGAASDGAGWSELAAPLAYAAGWSALLLTAGWVQLRRKVEVL